VRQSEYARMTGKDRRFIKGQKYTLLWHRDNLTLEGRQALKTLLAANKQYEKFAEMIDRHWDGIATYCKPENKVSLGFVDGLNNTRSASSSAAPTDCVTRTTCGSRSWLHAARTLNSFKITHSIS
jgi:hypothetical protein